MSWARFDLPAEAVRNDEPLVARPPRPRAPAPVGAITRAKTEHDEQFGNYGIVGRSRPMRGGHRGALELVAQNQDARAHHRRDRHRQANSRRTRDSQTAARSGAEMPAHRAVNCAADLLRRCPESVSFFGRAWRLLHRARDLETLQFGARPAGGGIFLDEIGTMRPIDRRPGRWLRRSARSASSETAPVPASPKIDVRVIAN